MKSEEFRKLLLKIAGLARKESCPDPVDKGADVKRTAMAIEEALNAYKELLPDSA